MRPPRLTLPEVLCELTDLQELAELQHRTPTVFYVLGSYVCPDEVKSAQLCRGLMAEAVKAGALDYSTLGYKNPYELSQRHEEFPRADHFALVVDFTGWASEEVENLFRFLSWVELEPVWKGRRILVLGSTHPWLIQNIEQTHQIILV